MDEISESDDFSEDVSVEENYAGCYGGYDDLYDNVNEEDDGYELWDDHGVHDFDKEWPLFVFERSFNSQLVHKSGMDILKMHPVEKEIFIQSISYATVLGIAMKCQDMCDAWRVRRDKKISPDEEVERNADNFASENKDMSLYQIDLSGRQHMRDFSVIKLIKYLGNESEVEDFFKEISTSVNLLKSSIFMIIRTCLPSLISTISPVVDQVLEHLILSRGLNYIGLVSQNISRQLVEAKYLISLCEELETQYSKLTQIMFYNNLRSDFNTLMSPKEIYSLGRQNLRAHVHILGKLIDEEIDLEDGGWTHNPSWEEDVIRFNNATEVDIAAMKNVFKLYSI